MCTKSAAAHTFLSDCACRELQDFAVSLYDSRGEICRAPRESAISDIYCFDGSMFLIEFVEIKKQFSGMDLGINFIHEYLAMPDIRRRVGVVVMKPWNLTKSALRYNDNKQKVEGDSEGKNESEKVDYNRECTIKLRRQFSRMGFAAVADTPDWVDKWYMSMEKYRTNSNPEVIKSSWMPREDAQQLTVPMPVKKHVNSEVEKELEELLKGLMPELDPYASQNEALSEAVGGIEQSLRELSDLVSSVTGAQLPSLQRMQDQTARMSEGYGAAQRSNLTEEKKLNIKRLVDSGASLHDMDALHVAAAHYKNEDLFELLIDEYGLNVESFDSIGRRPIHVAACFQNADAVRILIAKGADKNGTNTEGKTALQDMNAEERGMGDFGRMMMGLSRGCGRDTTQVRRLLS